MFKRLFLAPFTLARNAGTSTVSTGRLVAGSVIAACRILTASRAGADEAPALASLPRVERDEKHIRRHIKATRLAAAMTATLLLGAIFMMHQPGSLIALGILTLMGFHSANVSALAWRREVECLAHLPFSTWAANWDPMADILKALKGEMK